MRDVEGLLVRRQARTVIEFVLARPVALWECDIRTFAALWAVGNDTDASGARGVGMPWSRAAPCHAGLWAERVRPSEEKVWALEIARHCN